MVKGSHIAALTPCLNERPDIPGRFSWQFFLLKLFFDFGLGFLHLLDDLRGKGN
jgi:hypothetical protein